MTKPLPPLLRGLPRNHFVEIVADIPWSYGAWSPLGLQRSADRYYRTMPLKAMASLPVGQYCAPDSRLWFWVTGPFLAIGAHVPIMRAWGFQPTAIAFVWLKANKKDYQQGTFFRGLDDDVFRMGMGHTTRQNAEYVVLGRRGDPAKRRSRAIRQVIIEPLREHSRKPEKFYKAVENFGHAPRLDLFGRTQREGWTVRGDEAGKFDGK